MGGSQLDAEDTRPPAGADGDSAWAAVRVAPEDRAEFLRRFPLLASLTPKLLDGVANALVPTTIAQGETIIRQGDAGTHLYLIADGTAEVQVHEGTTSTTVATLRAGDCFGDMSLLTGDRSSADVVASTELLLLALAREDFERYVARHSGTLRNLFGVVSRRLATTGQHVAVSRTRRLALSRFVQEEHADRDRYHGFVGHPRTLAKVERMLTRERDRDEFVHIEGERGSGKDLIARLLHFEGPRKDGPLISANSAQISEASWGDRLFGAHADIGAEVAGLHGVAYMELAQGGTLVIQDIERLPQSIQYRLVRYLDGDLPGFAPGDVRVITTSHLTLAESADKLVPELAQRIAASNIPLIPLRDRKQDIPALAEHFIARHAGRLGRDVRKLDERALRKLVRDDYRIGNVTELEEVIERAVTLADTDTIYPEHIFLGSDAVGPDKGMGVALPTRLVEGAIRVRTVARWLLGAGFVTALAVLLVPGLATVTADRITQVLWSVGWPALVVSFVAGARTWCGVCPMGSAARVAQRFVALERRIPRWLVNNSPLIVMFGIAAIFWVEEVLDMRHEPVATGLLFTAIATGSIAVGVVFQRAAWCRYVCPLGAIAGTCASASVLEMRPTLDYCATRCKEHKCYTGTESVPGCPMYNHVMFLDSARYCTLCLNCVRACPNDSPRVHLRPPGQELWRGQGLSPETGRITLLLLGVVAALAALHRLERGPTADVFDGYRALLVTGFLTVGAAIPVLLATWRSRGLDGDRAAAFWRRITAWSPITAAGLVCYEFSFLPFGNDLRVGFTLVGSGDASMTVVSIARAAALGAGLAVAALVLMRARRDAARAGLSSAFWPSFVAMTAVCGVLHVVLR